MLNFREIYTYFVFPRKKVFLGQFLWLIIKQWLPTVNVCEDSFPRHVVYCNGLFMNVWLKIPKREWKYFKKRFIICVLNKEHISAQMYVILIIGSYTKSTAWQWRPKVQDGGRQIFKKWTYFACSWWSSWPFV